MKKDAVYSLIPYGLDAKDEEDLRFYLLEQRDKPEDWAGAERWNAIDAVLSNEWEQEEQIRQFLHRGFQSRAGSSAAARREHMALFPAEPLPAHIQPGAPGSVPYSDWLSRERAKPTFHVWLADLYEREATGGTLTGRERLVLDEIAREKRSDIENLVQRFNGRKAFLAREAARRKREEQRQAKAATPVPPVRQETPRRHRRYRELAPEPEIIKRRGRP